MKHIITTGLRTEDNFGCPSILHGINELLKVVYGNDFTMTNFQTTLPSPVSISDMPFETYTYSNSLKNLIKARIGISANVIPSMIPMKELCARIRAADQIIDLYGICFCHNLEREEQNYLGTLLSLYSKFSIPILAKNYHINTVKNTASYGPLITRNNKRMARIACNHIFDSISAREKMSREALLQTAGIKRRILLSPDVANLMPYHDNGTKKGLIGISTSHQIIKQWASEESYITCIVKLIKHIVTDSDKEVLLIPNEWSSNTKYNDINAAKDILDALGDASKRVRLLDVETITSTQLKDEIASCEALIASRYHSCVAALSSGVPILTLGWHYKYEELLNWYNQEKWIVSCQGCSSARLISVYDEFMGQIKQSKEIIRQRYPVVRDAIITCGYELLEGRGAE